MGVHCLHSSNRHSIVLASPWEVRSSRARSMTRNRISSTSSSPHIYDISLLHLSLYVLPSSCLPTLWALYICLQVFLSLSLSLYLSLFCLSLLIPQSQFALFLGRGRAGNAYHAEKSSPASGRTCAPFPFKVVSVYARFICLSVSPISSSSFALRLFLFFFFFLLLPHVFRNSIYIYLVVN